MKKLAILITTFKSENYILENGLIIELQKELFE